MKLMKSIFINKYFMDYQNSEPRDKYKDSKTEKFLGVKRNSSSLSDNFIFRRILTGKTGGQYEKVSNDYYNMLSFDWEDEKLSKFKTHPSKKIKFKSYL
jgi:hypothetical protein